MSITKTSNGFLLEADIDFTDNLFEFPVMLSMSKQKDKENEQLRKLGLLPEDDDDEDEDAHRLIGKIAFPHERIMGYGDWYHPDRTPEDIEQNGFDMTEVYINGEFQSYWCIWPREKFKEKLNTHVRELARRKTESVYKQYSEMLSEAKPKI